MGLGLSGCTGRSIVLVGARKTALLHSKGSSLERVGNLDMEWN